MEIIKAKITYKNNQTEEFIGENTFTKCICEYIGNNRYDIILSSKFRRGTGDVGNIWSLLTAEGDVVSNVKSLEIMFNENKIIINKISDILYNINLFEDTINNQSETLFSETMTIRSNKENNE